MNNLILTIKKIVKMISLVTGGAGFIGSNLCKKLLELGHTVICLDNLFTGNKKNILPFMNNPKFTFIEGNVISKISFDHIDYIWHLACPASPPKYQINGYETLLTSLIGTKNMLELAKEHHAKLLFTSTSEVYGDPLEHPQKETYWGNVNNMGPRSCYDEGKRCAETMIMEFEKCYLHMKNKLKIVRIFNTYGPNMDLDDGRVITNFIKCIQENKPVTVYGNGSQTRSFCYVDDLIDGFLKMMESNESGPINLGNPFTEINMFELKQVFEQVIDKKIEFTLHELPVDDPKKRKPDITLAKEKLGWEPKIDIHKGLTQMMASY